MYRILNKYELPLSLLPYLASLAIWLAATLAVFLLVLWRIGRLPLIFLLSLAFPGTWINFICGQNGFLSAALLGGGLLLLDRFPLVAGLLLGLLGFKPHLAFLVPVALLAGRHGKALLGEPWYRPWPFQAPLPWCSAGRSGQPFGTTCPMP